MRTCKWCGCSPTTPDDAPECDRCWEIKHRLSDPYADVLLAMLSETRPVDETWSVTFQDEEDQR